MSDLATVLADAAYQPNSQPDMPAARRRGRHLRHRRSGRVVVALVAVTAVASFAVARLDQHEQLSNVRVATSATTTTPPTSDAPAGAPPPCPIKTIAVSVSTDKASYRAGETIVIRTTLVNRSGRACASPNFYSRRIVDSDGFEVDAVSALGTLLPGAEIWLPGETQTREDKWDQRAREGDPQARTPRPGHYMAIVRDAAFDSRHRETSYQGTAAFDIKPPS